MTANTTGKNTGTSKTVKRSAIKGKGPGLVKSSVNILDTVSQSDVEIEFSGLVPPTNMPVSSSDESQVAGPSSIRNKVTSISSDSAGEGCFIDQDKVLEDKNGCSYRNKFTWPSKFTNQESRKQNEKIDPDSEATLGKKSTKPFFSQVTD